MNYYQIAIFIAQGTLVSFLILLLFHLRKKLGIGILFACLGLFQFMQAFLASTVYVEVVNNFLVSPGSSVLFPATLFAVLLIYIKEDASETRKIIYALLITNIAMSFLTQSFGWNIADSEGYNPFNVSIHLFNSSAWVLLVGTVTLFLDSLLIIILYEFISRFLSNLFLKICLTMIIVTSFDSLFFSIIAFWNNDNINVIITSGFISKGFFAIFYSVLFSIYLKYFAQKEYNTSSFKVKDIFQELTYRQKFEIARRTAIETSEEVKLSEIKYQALTNMSPVGIFHTCVDGYTTFVNPKWCQMAGLNAEEALGEGWKKAVHPDDLASIINVWNYATSQNQNPKVEYRLLLPDGSIKWVLGRAVAERDSLNNAIGYVGTVTDITDLKLFQKEQITLKEKAEESSLLKSAFLANMSHEIRTPMNGILGFTDLLKEPGLTGDDQKKFIEIIEKSGNRMLNTLNDIIDISKIEANQVTINFSEINLNHLLDELHAFFLPEATKKKIKLLVTNGVSANETNFKTDREKINSILTNLIKNAIKYTNDGTIEFGYNIHKSEIQFYVLDTGTGILKERQEAIFNRFVMADINNREAIKGSGLGLAISKAYVEMLGGTISLESTVGDGSKFSFTIPFYKNIDKKNLEDSTT